jgi:4-hydroxyphenylpyruvate dioxygenase-like putative hemolysin
VKGEGIHHIAFEVENIKEALSMAKEKNFRLIDPQSLKKRRKS